MFIVILLVTRLGLSAQLIMNVNRVYVKIYKIKAYAMWPTINNEDSVIVDPNCRTYKKLNRGDVIIFKNPINPRMVFVMRLVAFEGEKVEIKDGWVAVNDRALSGPPFNRFTYVSAGPYGSSSVTIPQKSVYVLGDYNKNSNDSRFWGFVPESYILGKVIKRFTPIQRQGLIE
ncbi:MAG: signal peptidase I [Candidatus Vogelbacteria bacterium]|nr:signal peptidase I [Candidatus Vogelbacteria bacterium]